jgi:hypothetical protein
LNDYVLRTIADSDAWCGVSAVFDCRFSEAVDYVVVGGYTKPQEGYSVIRFFVRFLFNRLLGFEILLNHLTDV